jgi:hypothetical protein
MNRLFGWPYTFHEASRAVCPGIMKHGQPSGAGSGRPWDATMMSGGLPAFTSGETQMGGGIGFWFGRRGTADVGGQFPSGWLKQAQKSIADELTERGLEPSLWARLRRWWQGKSSCPLER